MKRLHWVNYIKAMPWRSYRTEIKRYLLLLLIPLFLLVLLYVNVNRVITQQTEEYAELIVNHFYVQSASMLQELHLVSSAILHDSDVSNILEASTADTLDSLYICDIIRSSLRESPYVQHAYLICEKTGNIYSDEGLFGSDSLAVILSKVGADTSVLSSGASAETFYILNTSHKAPYCIVPVYGHDGDSLGTLIVSLRMMEFLHIFYSLDAELCTIFNDEVYISSYMKAANTDGFNWQDEASVSALVGKPVTCVYASHGGYTYLVAVSRENYNRPLHVIIQWFFIYAAAALILGCLYLHRVSKRRVKRISAMVDALPSSYTGDRSYEQVYENIRKSLEDYRTQREHLQLEGLEFALHSLLTSDKERTVTAEQFRDVGVDPCSSSYYVVTFFSTKVPDSALETDRAQGATGFLHMLFRSTIHELAEHSHIFYAFCGLPRINTAILYNDDEAALREIVPTLCENVIEILTNSYSMNIQATISNPVSSVLELPGAYQETQRLHSFSKSINSNAAVISQEKLQQSSGVLLNGDFIRQKQILINTILVRKYDMIPAMVESILDAHISPLRKNYALAQGRLLSIANDLAEGVRMSSVSGIASEEAAAAISQADSVHQLLLLTRQIYGRMAECSRESCSESNLVALACDYIARNLSDQNLSVSVICEAVGASVQRLTRMFQAQLGMAVAEYMNACRVKLAKELLSNRSLTVSQIAQQVGYTNADTLTRNFRKTEGITPSEYRKMLTEE